MCKKLLFTVTLFFVLIGYSQEVIKDSLVYDDPKYREDQFYLALTYNFMENKPTGVSQQGLSSGLHLGVIRDMPINEKRTLAIGVGLGYSNNSYNHNLLIQELDGALQYEVLSTTIDTYSKNKLNTHELALPVQFRWRNSRIESHKFWRIYLGMKFNYIFHSVVKHKGDVGNFKLKNPSSIQKFQPVVDLGFGWNTWNFYASYSLNTLLKDSAKVDGQSIDIRAVKFGLIFYIF